MATIGSSIVVLLVIVMIFGSKALAGHLLNDDTQYANKTIKHRRHTFHMEIKAEEELDNEKTIENDGNTHEEDEVGKHALTGSEISETEVEMPDIYLVSETKALKVSRRTGDMLRSCNLVDLSVVTRNDDITKIEIDETMMDNLAVLCDVSGLHGDSTNYQSQGLIYPGTQWCGPGNNAKNHSHLGSLKLVDACCRGHDTCNISINAMEYKYGLFHFGLWTKKSCSCDRDFYQCLKNIPRNETADAENADIIGNIFFDIVTVGCIQEDYPLTCLERSWWGKCLKFEPDTSRSKRMVFRRDDLSY